MNYDEFIQNILNTRGRFNCGEEYHERHHIIPKCMGGSNNEDNLIDLYAREHFIAHKLLAEENPDNGSLVYAYGCMAWAINGTQERYSVSGEEYEHAKIAFSNAIKGKPKSEETKGKMKIAKAGYKPPKETLEKAIAAVKGKPLSEEHKFKIGLAKKGVFTEKQRESMEKIWETQRGKHLSEEHIEKIRNGNKGKTRSEETRKRISAVQHGKSVAQYTLDTDVFIKKYSSFSEASRETGIGQSTMSRCANGIGKSAGGFNWKLCD